MMTKNETTAAHDLNALVVLLGPMATPTDFTVTAIESVDCGSYVREKIGIVLPDDVIPAYVLVPKIPGRKPAVYCYHQHGSNWDLGKSEVVGLAGDPDLAYAKELAERGFIAFAPDAICFEERKKNEDGWFGTYLEYTARVSRGGTLAGKVFADVRVCMDYLCSRDDVDSSSIGFIGHSYGGRVGLWIPALERRFKAVVSNCGCINHKDSFERAYGIQMEFTIPGFLTWGDVEDVLRLAEPAHVLISATEDDKYSFGNLQLYEYAKGAFRDGSLELAVYPGKHQFTEEMRLKAYDFLEHHLMPNPSATGDEQ